MDKQKERIISISDEILDHLLKYREEKDNTFTFSLRSRDSVRSDEVRLNKGQWFQGSHYIFVPLFKKGDSARKIKTLGFVVRVTETGEILDNYLEISFKKGQFTEAEKQFHLELAKKFGVELNDNRHGSKEYPHPEAYMENLEHYLSEVLPFAKDLLKKYDLEKDYIIPEREFHRNLDRIKKIKEDLISSKLTTNKKELKKNDKIPPLNQILYGPPGTGKTYSTIDLAAKIIGFDTGSHAENLKAFNERLGKNIEFVTFHQSFAYEDFIEGIKPLTSETKERGKQVTYEIQDGVFKKLATRARKASLSLKTQESQVKFERAFDNLKNELAASENDEIEIPMKRVSYHITGISSDYIKFRKSSGGTGHDLKVDVLRKMYTGDLQYAQEGLGIYYYPLVDYLKSKSEQAPETEEEKTEENHVLIIDEINRGNVAAIFGELITLIEEDKRAGGKNPISITLPYSKTEFSVPSNLYLIGTMNTADRSVEALDTALRRRFSFTEVGPEPELLSPKAMILSLLNREAYADLGWEEEPYHSHARKLYDFLGVAPDSVEAPLREKAEVGEGYWKKADLEHLSPDDFTGVKLDHLLRAINHRIARLIDRDHMIGHAYFMGIATAPDPWQALKEVFHRNILPLLQEYFFGDYAKIGLVLGSGFVGVEEAQEGDVFADFPYEASADLATQTQYTLKDVSKMSMPDFREAVWKISPDSNADKDG
jgi:5-methylcytosine-specific restriction endonuclease McrBC GTP-binding regulatory subunit McrB